MIRYEKASLKAIERLVDAHAKKWRADARKITATIKKQKKFIKGNPSWSVVKPVFMRLQHNKCVFCERPLGGERAGKGEQQVFPSYNFSTGEEGTGYYWLAYDLGNYAACCKPCNSARKSNYFPIAGKKRGTKHVSVTALNKMERPFLIYPLGKSDADPESLIGFNGILAMPVHATGVPSAISGPSTRSSKRRQLKSKETPQAEE
jgi:hypothetical protein